MNISKFPNFRSAYQATLQDLIEYGEEVGGTADPKSVGSNFGLNPRATKEIIGYSFAFDMPHDRALFLKQRRINFPFAVANCFWTLSGSDSLEFINFYNSRGALFSDDQRSLYGAHGKRLFDADGINQIKKIIGRIKNDPQSRRTVASIYHPVDNITVSRDIPCPIAVQFLQRDEKLHAITFMRSQSAAMVMPYDIFVFTFIQEAIAVALGLELGTYYHLCSSFHYYKDEEKKIKEILLEKIDTQEETNLIAPKMPKNHDPFDMINRILKEENQMRNQAKSHSVMPDLNDLTFPEYWYNLLIVLAAKITEEYGGDSNIYISKLPPYYARHFA